MSSNIYKHPELMTKVRYSRGVIANRRWTVKKEIYRGSDTSTDLYVDPFQQDGGAQTERVQDLQRNDYRIVALILGLLCVMLLGGISVLLSLYLMGPSKLEFNSSQIISPTGIQRANENQTLGKSEGWHWFRKQCFYASTEKKNWTESRKDCQRRGADLVVISSKDKQFLETKRT
ncbi:natural killer cells antigen CD94-like isoform X2 [Kryptolebias marmoratus]|uniref:natural killer cells antigen CD94-like isoform X2 n=1 Tax=Kryptolebias marmoratus TaxID=37003 RepID=UPI0018ACBA29|nr:natural killer cells antigen CD94-like isoform X2 [Kryptolebias marmoratus]